MADHTDGTQSKPTCVDKESHVAREITYVGGLLREIQRSLDQSRYDQPNPPPGFVTTVTPRSSSRSPSSPSSPEPTFSEFFVPDKGTDPEIWNTLADFHQRLTAGLKGLTETRFKQVLDAMRPLPTFAQRQVTYASVLKYQLDKVLGDNNLEGVHTKLESIKEGKDPTTEQPPAATTAATNLQKCISSLKAVSEWLVGGDHDAPSGYDLTSHEAKKAVLRRRYRELAPVLGLSLDRSRQISELVEGVLSKEADVNAKGQTGYSYRLNDYTKFVKDNFKGQSAETVTDRFRDLRSAIKAGQADKIVSLYQTILGCIQEPVRGAEEHLLGLNRAFYHDSATSPNESITKLRDHLSKVQSFIETGAAGKYEEILKEFCTDLSKGLGGAEELSNQYHFELGKETLSAGERY